MKMLLVLHNQAGDELGRLALPTVICAPAGDGGALGASLPVSAQMPALCAEIQAALAKEGLVCLHDEIELARAVSKPLLQPTTAGDIQVNLPVQERRPQENTASAPLTDASSAAPPEWNDLFALETLEENNEAHP